MIVIVNEAKANSSKPASNRGVTCLQVNISFQTGNTHCILIVSILWSHILSIKVIVKKSCFVSCVPTSIHCTRLTSLCIMLAAYVTHYEAAEFCRSYCLCVMFIIKCTWINSIMFIAIHLKNVSLINPSAWVQYFHLFAVFYFRRTLNFTSVIYLVWWIV